jgi:hypothetical protein
MVHKTHTTKHRRRHDLWRKESREWHHTLNLHGQHFLLR